MLSRLVRVILQDLVAQQLPRAARAGRQTADVSVTEIILTEATDRENSLSEGRVDFQAKPGGKVVSLLYKRRLGVGAARARRSVCGPSPQLPGSVSPRTSGQGVCTSARVQRGRDGM